MSEEQPGYEARKGARQLWAIVSAFHDTGRCDAHLMLVKHGITRAATYIWLLRHRFGWDIETVREPGEMAVYLLKSPPADFWAPVRPRRPVAWVCGACGYRATTLDGFEKVSGGTALGICPVCEKRRVWSRR